MAVALALVLVLLAPSSLLAQRADSTRVGVASRAPQPTDTLNRLRVSPGRAFLTSLLVPGLGQSRLKRPKAALFFVAIEAGAVGMSVKSWNDLSKAKAARSDTVGTPVVDNLGKPVIDSVTGVQKVTYAPRNPNLVGRIKARRTHLEDWLATVVFNHLIAGADAYVAANLSDFDTNVRAGYSEGSVRVAARVAW
jgi:hypothetical protein